MSENAYRRQKMSLGGLLGKSRYRKWYPGILVREDFHRLIEYERVRSDRDGSAFSLVLFDVSVDLPSRKGRVKSALERLRTTIRLVDHIGWFEDREIGILLPATDYERAERFVAALEARVSDLGYTVSIFTYPDKRFQHRIIRFPDPSEGKKRGSDDSGKGIFDSKNSGGLKIAERLKDVFAYEIPVWKRLMDVTGSLAGLVVLSPLFIFIIVYIKLVSPGPAFFSQERVGYEGRLFRFIKFRTMHVNIDSSGHNSHLKDLIGSDKPMVKLDNRNDPRIIPGGKILRKLAIDEFPQLVNILKGEMSLVGPRPCIPYEAEEYLRWHARRFDIIPGLTGLWQVSGKNKLTFMQMIRLDIAYARNMSLLGDLFIILKTGPAIIEMVLESLNDKLDPSFSAREDVEFTDRQETIT